MRPTRRHGLHAAYLVSHRRVSQCLFTCVLLVSSTLVHAQSASDCGLHGTVISPFGESAANALVTLRGVDTGIERTLKSGPDGTFLFPGLPPGEYVIGASAPGFIRLRHASVILTLGAVAEVYLPLGLRALRESVEVQADKDSAPLETSIFPAELESLPIQSRRWQSFALLAPLTAPDQDGDGLISFRGLASTQNSLVIDGTDANQSFSSVPSGTGSDPVADPDEETDSISPNNSLGLARGRGNGAVTNFASSAVREFRVTGQSYSVLTGHAAGGTVIAVTRSGTAQLHGAAFLLLRSSAFAATNPLSIDTTYTNGLISSSLVKPNDFRETFGGTIGGPILPTRIHTRRLFYFYSFEGEDRDFPAISSPAYPAFYSLTPTQAALLANRGVKQAAISSALTYLSSLTGSVPRTSQETIHFGKLDWQITHRNSFGLQYNRLRSTAPAGVTSAPTIARGRASLGDSAVALDSFVPRLTSTLGTHFVNDLRLQISRDLQHQRPQPNLPQEPTIGPGGQSPEIDIAPNGFLFGTPAALSHQAYPDERRDEATDTISLALGRHFLQLGGDLSLVHDRVATLPNAAGTFHYDSSLVDGHAGGLVDWITDYTFSVHAYPNGACPSINAKIHLFCFHSFTQSFGVQTIAFDTQEWAGFAQDQWRPWHNLTITAGVRYEYELLPFPQQPNAVLDQIFGKIGATSVFPEDRNNAGPRASIAWEPAGPGGMLIRIGYGAFFGRLPGATIRTALADTALPLSSESGSTTHIRITPATITDCPQVANQGFGYACSYTATPPAAVASTTSARVFDRHFRLPLIQQASLSLEKNLSPATALSATYIMNLDRQLPNSTDINIAPSTALKRFQLQGGTGTNGIVSGQTFAVPFYTARVSPLFGPVSDILSNVSGTYNALVVTLTRSSRRGFDLHAGYTWSKAIDFGQSATGTPRTDGQFDPFNIRYDRALSALNYPQSLTASVIWRPAFKSGLSWLDHAANGWSLASILTARSGRPYTFQVFGGTALPGGRESINGSGGAVYLPTVGRNTLRLPSAINVDLRLVRTIPISRSPDSRTRLRLTAEAFNLANHRNLSSVEERAFLVGAAVGGITPLTFQDAPAIAQEGLNNQAFGTPTSASASLARERQLQLGIRLDF